MVEKSGFGLKITVFEGIKNIGKVRNRGTMCLGFTLPKGAKLIAKFSYVNGTYIYFTVGKAAVDVFLAAKKKKYKKWLKEMKAKDKKLEEKTIYKYGRSNNRLGYYVYSISCKVV